MKKRALLIISFALILIILSICVLFVFRAQIMYNAKMYSQSEELILPSFLEENKVRGAFYLNHDYDPDDENSNEYYREKDAPENRILIIDNADTFNEIFKNNALDVNWDKEILLLYIFSDVNPHREYKLKNISSQDGNIKIYYKLEGGLSKDSTAPYPRCLIVKMRKQSIHNVEFIEK